ncbi:MAG TPA: hypothetical protein VLW50_06965 [Streptosporangiaceae bacterium]|nr:hypothetical protein [Streptosporangiaceae bacterium]
MTPHRSDPKRRAPALGIRAIVAAAARAGRRSFWRIVAVAIVVSTAAALLETAAHDLVDRTNVPAAILADLGASSVSVLGVVFLAGFLSRLVGEAENRQEHASISDVLRNLPWRRLICADLMVVLLVVVGLIALIIPGLIALNLLAVVGPVIEIEHRRVCDALRRSAHLVRKHFWGVFLLATLPVLIAGELPAAVPHSADLGRILEFLAIHGVAEGLIEAALGLVLVELCYRLIELDRATPPEAKAATKPAQETGHDDGPSAMAGPTSA